jgi:hypothetical protein
MNRPWPRQFRRWSRDEAGQAKEQSGCDSGPNPKPQSEALGRLLSGSFKAISEQVPLTFPLRFGFQKPLQVRKLHRWFNKSSKRLLTRVV